jgi:uncharacterized membrane protein
MQTSTGIPLVDTFLGKLETQIINPAITLLALAAFVVFAWGVVEYIRNAANDEKRAQGQQHIIWGLVGLFILFSAAAIVHIISSTATSVFGQ